MDLKVFSAAQMREKEEIHAKKVQWISSLSALGGWFLGFLVATFIGVFHVEDIKIENATLQYHVDTYQQRLTQMEQRVDQIAFRDLKIYRKLFGLESKELVQSEAHELSIKTIDDLEGRIDHQARSLREISDWQLSYLKDLQQTPMLMPVQGYISSPFGMRVHPILGVRKFHRGIDIAVYPGTAVQATANGEVSASGYDRHLGHYVKLFHEHTSLYTLYAHLSSIPSALEAGSTVKRGDVIGFSGNSGLSDGPHLHYEIQDAEGRSVDPRSYILSDIAPMAEMRIASLLP